LEERNLNEENSDRKFSRNLATVKVLHRRSAIEFSYCGWGQWVVKINV